MSYEGEALWITGACRGIGRALAEHLARPGMTLGLSCRCKEHLSPVANACRAKGATVWTYQVDVVNNDDCLNAATDFLERTGRIDEVVANAGISLIEDENYEDPEIAPRLINVNYFGVINTFRPFIPVMKRQRAGRLAAISSIAAIRATVNSGAYSASKSAVDFWAEGLRQRLIPYNVSVTVLNCGFVKTDMTKDLPFRMPGALSPEQAAIRIARYVRQRRRTATFPLVSKAIFRFFGALPGSVYDTLLLYLQSKHRTVAVDTDGQRVK